MIEQELLEVLIDEIKVDIKLKDTTAIEELLRLLPRDRVIEYLPEEIREDFI